ncbi:MAG: polymer-forming cytoskeletal protein [Deltaproteobacteria bacterium]|nr:polymer-forming cytoskeletal protein [Deltaproteobacteria bacterium]MBW2419196.1 polymer-forming cytoskeletal protein [Deltaproteobacteria bacterium]
MAISGFGRGTSRPGEPISAPAAPARPPAAGNLTAFIDQGSTFEGKLSFKDTVRIDGGFNGEITSENTLIVGETGEIAASIRSTTVVISGSVEGDIQATSQVFLHKTARVKGDIDTPSIVVEEGAVFNGKLTMDQSGAKGAKKFESASGGGKPVGQSVTPGGNSTPKH